VFSAHAAQTFRDMLLWARAIKQRTGLPILVGGYEAKALCGARDLGAGPAGPRAP